MALRLIAAPDQKEKVVHALRRFAGPTKVEPGCISCNVYQDTGNANALLYEESWTSWERIASHIRTSRFAQLIQLMETSAETPVLQFHQVQVTRGMEYMEKVRHGLPAETK